MLSDIVSVEERFQRSIRIEFDLNKKNALQGFICPKSSKNALISLANHIHQTGQSAFTWTGPYGSGKSSLAVLFSALCSANEELRKHAIKIISPADSEKIIQKLPFNKLGYLSIPIMGVRASPAQVIGESLQNYGLFKKNNKDDWSTLKVINLLRDYLNQDSTHGIILFIDEMGKFLEAAAQDKQDIHIFQELAEEANRSNGKFILINILHQAFASYANNLSLDIRDEWTKIQGRYVDIPINPVGEEQIFLLGQAIKKNNPIKSSEVKQAAVITAKVIRKNKAAVSSELIELLKNTWPLHPVSAVLLAALSRKRFGQNQRSIFAFLNSAEPFAFQSFLNNAQKDSLYYPYFLWDYLKVNFEPTIINSTDSQKWLIASDIIDRCNATFDNPVYGHILKIIALLDIFRQTSGLLPTEDLLKICVPQQNSNEIRKILKTLIAKSFIIYRKHLSAYSIYAGSDFDIEEALKSVKNKKTTLNLEKVESFLQNKNLLARRHFFETGTHRWVDIKVVSHSEIKSQIDKFQPDASLFGRCLIVIPSQNYSHENILTKCKELSIYIREKGKCILLAIPVSGKKIVGFYQDLIAYQNILEEYPELQGDQIARKEVAIRLSLAKNALNTELNRALMNSDWVLNGTEVIKLNFSDLNAYISKLADKAFSLSPKIRNELLNRSKPSGSAIAGQNSLLRAMIFNSHEERLGIKGYPVEAGLYDSIIKAAQIHRKINNNYAFVCPNEKNDPLRLFPLWRIAIEHLKGNANKLVSFDEIHKIWTGPAYGLKKGLLPILSTAFLLSQSSKIAIYREEVFRHEFTDTDVTYLAKEPRSIQLRWVDFGKKSEILLKSYFEIASKLGGLHSIDERRMEALEIARALIKIYDEIPEWGKRTSNLPDSSIKLRNILHNAFDPNELLFIDLPKCYELDFNHLTSESIEELKKRLYEDFKILIGSYSKMIKKLKKLLLKELRAEGSTNDSLEQLHIRASQILKGSGDFRLNAFINHIANFDGSELAMERIASLAANKPPKNWVDIDFDRASLEIAEFAENFIRTELYRKIENKDGYWHSYAVMYRSAQSQSPIILDFKITEKEQKEAKDLKEKIKDSLSNLGNINNQIILAALASLSNEVIKIENGK